VPSNPRITADFNYGGLDGESGVVYLDRDTLGQLERAGIELREGMSLTLWDFDGTPDEPTWLIAAGVVSMTVEGGTKSTGWKFAYPRSECRWEPRSV
jgi:hypothetical protein